MWQKKEFSHVLYVLYYILYDDLKLFSATNAKIQEIQEKQRRLMALYFICNVYLNKTVRFICLENVK